MSVGRRAAGAEAVPRFTWTWAVTAVITIAGATGLAQAAVLAWRLLIDQRIIFQSRDFVWMAPAGYLLVLGTLALPAMGIAALADGVYARRIGRRWFAGVLLFLGGFALALLATRIHRLAQAALALGFAVQASPVVARLSERALGRMALALMLLTGTLGIGERIDRAARERREAALVPAPPSGRPPNVLLIVLDTVRAASLTLYGYGRPTTPALARWASEGATFDAAFSPAPWTFPSHASMFTGKLPSSLQARWDVSFGRSVTTIAEAFRNQGYETAGFVANTYFVAYDSGLTRGFTHYEDYQTSLQQALRSTMLLQLDAGRWVFGFDYQSLGQTRDWLWHWMLAFNLGLSPNWEAHQKSAEQVTTRFLDWQARSAGRPFFTFLNYLDAHEGPPPPRRYRTLFATDPTPVDVYDGSIRYLDDEVDRLLSTLRERGLLDNTVVIVTSDHGQQFGEHGLEGHANSLYSQLLWVPLVIRYPARVPANTHVAAAVSLTALPATLTDLAGLDGPRFPGVSLASVWEQGTTAGEITPVVSELSAREGGYRDARHPPVRSIVAGELHWFRWFGGAEHLYDYRRDPGETRDLVTSIAHRSQLAIIEADAAALDSSVSPP